MATNHMRPIRILIADDHHEYRHSLRKVIDVHDGLKIIGEADDGHKAVALVSHLRPDVLLMDVNLPALDSIEATRQIIEENSTVSVIILTLDSQDDRLFRAIRVGALSYLLKDAAASTIVETIRAVFQGKVVLDPHLTSMLFDELRALSV